MKNDLAPLKGKVKAASLKTRSQFAANANKVMKSRKIYATLKIRIAMQKKKGLIYHIHKLVKIQH